MEDIGAARKLCAGSPLGHGLHILIFFFFLKLNMLKKKIAKLAARFFLFSFPLCLLFICRCTGGLFTLLKRMRDPRDAALHAMLLWKGLGEEKGRNFQAF